MAIVTKRSPALSYRQSQQFSVHSDFDELNKSSWLQTGDFQDYDSFLEPVQTLKLFGLHSNSALCERNLSVWLTDERRRQSRRIFAVKLEMAKDVQSQDFRPMGS